MVKYWSVLSLLLFAFFFASTNLFPHVHEGENGRIVHSHPWSANSHSHTDAQYQTILLLSGYTFQQENEFHLEVPYLAAEAELSTLRTIASQLGLPNADVESILALFGQSVESAYKVLEITPDATDDEVKRAYKRMAMKYHPDRVATLGEDVRLKAEEKFKAVAEAYECIKKERGL